MNAQAYVLPFLLPVYSKREQPKFFPDLVVGTGESGYVLAFLEAS